MVANLVNNSVDKTKIIISSELVHTMSSLDDACKDILILTIEAGTS